MKPSDTIFSCAVTVHLIDRIKISKQPTALTCPNFVLFEQRMGTRIAEVARAGNEANPEVKAPTNPL